MAKRRSLHALRAWVRDMKADAKKRGYAPMMSASWQYTYRPAEDPESDPQEITESQFLGTADAEDDDLGHPRPGTYTAQAVANPDSEDEIILAGPMDGEWIGDDKIEKPEETGMAAAVTALTKAMRSSVELASHGEQRAMRLKRQAEEREAETRQRHEETLDAMAKLRADLHIAEIARQSAEFDKQQAEAERDAAKADLAEFQREGGELAPLASAGMTRLYQLFCEHMGEPALALEKEAMDEAFQECSAHLIDTYVTLDDGRRVLLALVMHYNFGMPWRPLRVLFFTTWGVDFKEAPPVDWEPPPIKDGDAPAAEEIH